MWRETLLQPGERHVIDLVGSENSALIENPANAPPFSVRLSNCNPQPLAAVSSWPARGRRAVPPGGRARGESIGLHGGGSVCYDSWRSGAVPDTAWGRHRGMGRMEANLLGAQPSAIALDQRVNGNGYPQPAADGAQQGAEETGR